MKSTRYWHKIIRYSVAEDVDLKLCLRKQHGKLERFSLVFRYKISGKWHTIKRCDNTRVHGGIPHCHIYKIKGKQAKEIVGDKKDNMGIIAAAIINDLKKNYIKVVENYKFNN
jgi:hypothetical protein